MRIENNNPIMHNQSINMEYYIEWFIRQRPYLTYQQGTFEEKLGTSRRSSSLGPHWWRDELGPHFKAPSRGAQGRPILFERPLLVH